MNKKTSIYKDKIREEESAYKGNQNRKRDR